MWQTLLLGSIGAVVASLVLAPLVLALGLRVFPTRLVEAEADPSGEGMALSERAAGALSGMTAAGLLPVGRFRSPGSRRRGTRFTACLSRDRLVLGVVMHDRRVCPWELRSRRADGRFWSTGPDAAAADTSGSGDAFSVPGGWGIDDAVQSHRQRLMVAAMSAHPPVAWDPRVLPQELLDHERYVAAKEVARGIARWTRRDDPGGQPDAYRWRARSVIRLSWAGFWGGLMEETDRARFEHRLDRS